MDEFLTQLFGTAENLQKIASAEEGNEDVETLLVKAAAERVDEWNQQLAAEEGVAVDFDELSDEDKAELLNLATQEILSELGEEGAEEYSEEDEGEEYDEDELVETAMSKLAEAEMFGRQVGSEAVANGVLDVEGVANSIIENVKEAGDVKAVWEAVRALPAKKKALLAALLGTPLAGASVCSYLIGKHRGKSAMSKIAANDLKAVWEATRALPGKKKALLAALLGTPLAGASVGSYLIGKHRGKRAMSKLAAEGEELAAEGLAAERAAAERAAAENLAKNAPKAPFWQRASGFMKQKKVAIPAALLAAAGLGYGGYRLGKRKGGSKQSMSKLASEVQRQQLLSNVFEIASDPELLGRYAAHAAIAQMAEELG